MLSEDDDNVRTVGDGAHRHVTPAAIQPYLRADIPSAKDLVHLPRVVAREYFDQHAPNSSFSHELATAMEDVNLVSFDIDLHDPNQAIETARR